MAEKRGEKEKTEALGISGFTLGIVSLSLIVMIVLFSAYLAASIIAMVGFIFCLKQQKKNKTKHAKIGIILNIVGFVANLVLFIYIFITQTIPYLNQLQG